MTNKILYLIFWITFSNSKYLQFTKVTKIFETSPNFFNSLFNDFIAKNKDKEKEIVVALNNITLSLPSDQIICLVGDSGAGKSTISKLLCNRNINERPSSGTVLYDNQSCIGEIICPLTYMNYNRQHSIHQILSRITTTTTTTTTTSTSISDDNKLIDNALSLFNLQSKATEGVKIESLIESDKKLFEIVYALSVLQQRKKELTSNDNNDNSPAFILIFDEYFDRDMEKVRNRIFKAMKDLLFQSIGSENRANHNASNEIPPVMLVVTTHSQAVMNDCDLVIALHKGNVFSYGTPDKVTTALPLMLP